MSVFGGAATRLGRVEEYGARGDGVTDDSAAFTAALAANGNVTCGRGKIYVVKDLVVGTNKTLDGRGAILRAATGARWVVRLEGFRPQVRDFEIEDAAENLLRATTLTADALAGATSITVASAAGIELPMAIAIEHSSGRWHKTLVTSVAGSTINLQRAVPAALATTSGMRVWAMHGAVWLTGNARYFVLENLLFKDCRGALSVREADFSGAMAATKGRVANLRGYGARMFGVAIHRNCGDIDFSDLELRGPATVVHNATGDGATTIFTLPENVVRIGATPDLSVTVNGSPVSTPADYTLTGPRTVQFVAAPANGASIVFTINARGIVGIWSDVAAGGALNGGHRFQATILGCYDGIHLVDTELYDFRGGLVDSIAGDGVRLEGNARNLTFDGFQSLFTGETCVRAVGGSTVDNVVFDGLRTTRWPAASKQSGVLGNVIDLTSGSAISISAAGWFGDKELTGTGVLSVPGAYILHFNTGATTVPAGSTVYTGPSSIQTATEQAANWAAPCPVRIIQMALQCGSAPGTSESFTCTLRDNATNTAAVATIAGTGVFENIWRGGVSVSAGRSITFSIVTTAAAVATRFRGYAVAIPQT